MIALVAALAATACGRVAVRSPNAAGAGATVTTADTGSTAVGPTPPGRVAAGSVTTVAPSASVGTTTTALGGSPVATDPPPPAGGGTAPCRTSGLQVAPATAKPVGNTRTQMFTVSNTTAIACSMTGYPSIAPYATQAGGGGSSSVQALLQPIPAPRGAIGGAAQLVTVTPGQAAVFFLTWNTGGGACQSADGITFNTPIASTIALVAFPFRFCGTVVMQSVVLPAGTAA